MKRILLTAAVSLGTALSVVGSSGCALTTKGDVVTVRYFSPEHLTSRLTAAAVAAPGPPGAEMRPSRGLVLGAVSSGSNLRERIVFRSGAHEIGYYEDFRWTERPETYVRQVRGERAVGGAAREGRHVESGGALRRESTVDDA